MSNVLTAALLLLPLAATPPRGEASTKAGVAILPFRVHQITTETAKILEDVLINEVHADGTYRPVSTGDIEAMLGLEGLKEAAGCTDVTCAAEIGGALGVPYLIAGTLSRLGGELIVSVQLIDVTHNEVARRAQIAVADDEQGYRSAVKRVVAELLGQKSGKDTGSTTGFDLRAADEANRQFVIDQDWQRYVRYQQETADPMSLGYWALEQNRESWALFLGEVASAVAFVATLAVPKASNSPLNGLPILSGIVGIGLGVVDFFDLGSVQILDGPTPGPRDVVH